VEPHFAAKATTSKQQLSTDGRRTMTVLSLRSTTLGLALSAGSFFHPAHAEDRLPAFNAALTQTSVSGISSGAYMAVQFATAWSSIIKGVGAIAGGPFGCSDGSGSTAQSTCMLGAPPLDLAELIRHTNAWSQSGAIDPVSNIAAQKIYLFNGYNDSVVARLVSDSLRRFYAHYLGSNQGNLFYQTAIGAGHAQVTLTYGGPCQANGGEYINHCGYDQAGIILQHIYGALASPNQSPLDGTLHAFRQAEFTAPDQPNDDSLDETGFVYVPAPCAAGETCVVHVALHGCLQSRGDIGQDFVQHAGYNAWADANHIIVLYPQAHALGLNAYGVANPNACWDWWGYLDADPTVHPTYLLKTGKQISAIKRMIDRLTSGTTASPTALSSPATVLLAADRTDTSVDLVWSALPGATTYAVFRADSPGQALRRIGRATGLSYADAGLHPATTYRYAVSVDPSLPGAASVTVTTRRKVPKCVDPGHCVVR
jgi:hypothetical protein